MWVHKNSSRKGIWNKGMKNESLCKMHLSFKLVCQFFAVLAKDLLDSSNIYYARNGVSLWLNCLCTEILKLILTLNKCYIVAPVKSRVVVNLKYNFVSPNMLFDFLWYVVWSEIIFIKIGKIFHVNVKKEVNIRPFLCLMFKTVICIQQR